MSQFLLTVLVFCSSSVFAATVDLIDGESITINANTETTVTCEGDGTVDAPKNCTKATNAFKQRMEFCRYSYANGTCMQQEWPRFKSMYPSCAYESSSVCMEYCRMSFGNGTCLDMCS